jgi:hypothetical protein
MFFDPVYPPTVTGFNPFFEQCATIADIEEPEIPVSTNSIDKVYPNPAGNEVKVDVALKKAGKVTISVFNLLGSEVVKETSLLDAGNSSLILNVDKLPEGQYFLRFSVDNQFVEARKLIVSR